MSGADDLRTAIEEAVSAYTEPETLGHRAERVLEIIEDQKYALAILNLIGDVHEGHYWGKPCIVVLPRGEATDA